MKHVVIVFKHKNRGFWRRNVSLWLGSIVSLLLLFCCWILLFYEWCRNDDDDDDEIRMCFEKRIEIDRFELWSLFRAAVEWIQPTERICRNRKQNNSHSKRPAMYHYKAAEWFFSFVVVLKSITGGSYQMNSVLSWEVVLNLYRLMPFD